VGTHTSYEDLGPGLHVLREAEPLKRAGPMAANLRADLCATLPQAEAALTERSGFPLVDASALSTLQVLARRVARAERIAARTRERAVTDVGHRLTGAGAGLAVHPTTIRDRAAAVDVARLDLAAADRALADHAAAVAAAEDNEAAEAAAAAADAEAAAAQRTAASRGVSTTRRSRAIGIIVMSFGLALVLVAVGEVALWVSLLPVLVACFGTMRYLRPTPDAEDEGWEEASSLLSQVSASADEAFGIRWASREHEGEGTLLRARRDRAQEEVRVAERAWQELAGEGVDVSELEEVVRRYDPQHDDARLLADETVGVRTADVVLHHFQQRWLAFWRELGLDAPTAEAGEEAVRALAARVSRPIVLVGPATVRGSDLARVAPAAPVVVLDGPTEELDELS
jgi:hypothetical protein